MKKIIRISPRSAKRIEIIQKSRPQDATIAETVDHVLDIYENHFQIKLIPFEETKDILVGRYPKEGGKQ